MATKVRTSSALDNTERNPLILVVDDDLHIRKMLRHLLEVGGHEVIEAEDGRTAWNIVLARNPAVLVTDLQMPGLDGFSLCRALRDAGFQKLSIIVYTGQRVTAEETRDAGADELVMKSEPLSRLRDLVMKVRSN
ncbi:MAG TPA: response regulator [Candidatus Dormibacteraeota bacterium]